MKRAVSISIGAPKRDKSVVIELLGEQISLERVGTNGDIEAAAQKYKELDGLVDAFGLGGGDLGALVDGRWYPFYSLQPMIRYIKKTPLVDGTGLKNTVEAAAASFLEQNLGEYIQKMGRKVLIPVGIDRWGISSSFPANGYEVIYGDLLFALGLPLALRSPKQIKNIAALLMPIVGRLPFEWLYPLGEKQETRDPRKPEWFHWATVIAGDCHYIKRHMPEKLPGKIIFTNTTTPEDVDFFRQAGVAYLVTSTPIIDGRSFGTNLMEAALVAISGKARPLSHPEYQELLTRLGLFPTLQKLN